VTAFVLLFSLVPSDIIKIEPFELVQGFANPALIMVICLLLIGMESSLELFPQLTDMTVMMVVRRAIPIRPAFEDIILRRAPLPFSDWLYSPHPRAYCRSWLLRWWGFLRCLPPNA